MSFIFIFIIARYNRVNIFIYILNPIKFFRYKSGLEFFKSL